MEIGKGGKISKIPHKYSTRHVSWVLPPPPLQENLGSLDLKWCILVHFSTTYMLWLRSVFILYD